MKCPDCGKQLIDTAKICPYCRCKITAPTPEAPQPKSVVSKSPPLFQVEETQNNKETVRQKNGVLAVVIIVAGIFIIGGLIIYQTILSKEKQAHSETTATNVSTVSTTRETFVSKNQGTVANFYDSAKIGSKVLASFYDSQREVFTDVDVVGLMFLSQEEIQNLGLVPKDQKLYDGFAWRGIKYRIIFNDLEYLKEEGVNPLDLEASILDESGLAMLTINNHNYKLTYTKANPNATASDGSVQMVKNGESVDLYLIYQKPVSSNNKLKVCFGSSAKTMSCFSDY